MVKGPHGLTAEVAAVAAAVVAAAAVVVCPCSMCRVSSVAVLLEAG